ncbi:hypothetical protein [Azohydromonas aeria]|uniref:hypothetical protein n=1 Tax=Azohydromonas aeria TaxID=2590212 RepID=UPI0012F73818|nr:hypothetical protein [Azohydromonas aeria]
MNPAPLRPTSPDWQPAQWWECPAGLASATYSVDAWTHPATGLFVLSAVDTATAVPEHVLGISVMGCRCTDADARLALAAFGMQDAQEDHTAGDMARNWSRPIGASAPAAESP